MYNCLGRTHFSVYLYKFSLPGNEAVLLAENYFAVDPEIHVELLLGTLTAYIKGESILNVLRDIITLNILLLALRRTHVLFDYYRDTFLKEMVYGVFVISVCHSLKAFIPIECLYVFFHFFTLFVVDTE